MIILLLFLTTLETVSTQQDRQYPDYYAVLTGSDYRYKVFTRRKNCTKTVYESGDNRVLLKVGQKWIIGSLDNDDELECENKASTIDDKHYEYTGAIPANGHNWINIKESTGHNEIKAYVGIKSLNKCEEIEGLKLDSTTFYFHLEDCENKDFWATTYPGQTVFVSINTKDSQCSFDLKATDVELVEEISAKLLIHSSCGQDENGGAVEQTNSGGKDEESNNKRKQKCNLFS